MRSTLGQISGCLDTAWTVLGQVLGQTWCGFLGCPETARRVLGSNRGEREALLDAFPRDFCGEQIQGENPCQSDSVRHEFLLEFVYHNVTAACMHLLWELPSSSEAKRMFYMRSLHVLLPCFAQQQLSSRCHSAAPSGNTQGNTVKLSRSSAAAPVPFCVAGACQGALSWSSSSE